MEIREDGTVVEYLGGGKPFAFKATLKNVAAFQEASGITGIAALSSLVASSDVRAVRLGLKHLCISRHAEQLEEIAIGPFLPAATEILVTAIAFAESGLNFQEEKELCV